MGLAAFLAIVLIILSVVMVAVWGAFQGVRHLIRFVWRILLKRDDKKRLWQAKLREFHRMNDEML